MGLIKKIWDSTNSKYSTVYLKILLVVILLILTIVIVRTVNISKRRRAVKQCQPSDADFIALDVNKLDRFQNALQYKTISWSRGNYSTEQLHEFGNFLIKSFPTIHARKSPYVEWERVNNYSFLYHIKGRNSKLRPYMLMSHLDVVPVSNPEVWDAPPFGGQVLNGYVYGRGSMDVKQTTMGILEALQYLLEHDIRPERSFFIAFGHDEEIKGWDGAAHLSKALVKKGVTELEFISDEGMTITDGIIKGLRKPVACIGVVEKGQLILKLSVQGSPGHSSMPPRDSTIGILAKAVHNLESNPHPSQLGNGVEKVMFEHLAPEVNVLQRIILANIWLFKPALAWFLSLVPSTNSLIRTVTSVTMFNAGIKHNVIPPYAEAIVNHRIHPSQTVQEVIDYDRDLISDDRVKIEVLSRMDPHPVAGHSEHDFGYQVMKTSITQVWPSVLTVPAIMVGNTDTFHYLKFTKNVYRFSPTFMYPGDPERFHGNNERISVKNYEQVINFYYHLMRNSDQHGVSSAYKTHEEF